ncbi:MAG: hormogonium polysaccharide biosynthesis protein HpsL [Phormidesmis sp.]
MLTALSSGLTMAKKNASKSSAKSRKGSKKGAASVRENKSVAESLSPRQKLLQARAATARRKATISYLTSVILGCAFVGLLVGLIIEPKAGIAAGGALACLVISSKYQRLALYAFIIYIPFAGTVTYALGGNPLLQIAKDIFYIPALIGVYQFCRKNRLPIILPQAIKPPLILLVIVVSITVLVTNLPDQIMQVEGRFPMIMAIWGAKVIFGYIPIIACIYYLIRNLEDLVFILRLQTVLVLVACSLGLVQYFMLKTGICAGTVGVGEELFRASLDSRCFVGGSLLYAPSVNQIRLPGTFVAPWQWGWFLISGVFFSFGSTFSDKSLIWRTIGGVSLVVLMVMAVISGQRIALAIVPVSIGLLTILTGQVKNLKRFLPIVVVLGLILFYLVASNPAVIEARLDSFVSRWEAAPPQRFIEEQFSQAWSQQEGIFGEGVGRATNSARTFASTTLIETYHAKVMHEIGLVGLVAVLALYTTLTVVTFKVYRRTQDKGLRSYAAAMWVYILFISYCPYYYPLDVDPVGVYYWLAAGIILKIPELERQEREKALLAQGIEAPSKSKRGRRSQKAQATFE